MVIYSAVSMARTGARMACKHLKMQDSFVWHNSKYAQFKNASEKMKSTPSVMTRHLSGNFLDKIEGLQYGIRTFENTPIKEVYHIMKKGGSLELGLISRSCRSGSRSRYCEYLRKRKRRHCYWSRLGDRNVHRIAFPRPHTGIRGLAGISFRQYSAFE